VTCALFVDGAAVWIFQDVSRGDLAALVTTDRQYAGNPIPDRAEVQFSLHNVPRRRPGSESDAGRFPRVTQVLALALSFQDLIATGKARSYKDLANRAGVTAERLSHVMKLIWLAPAIQQEILYLRGCGGRYPLTECAVRSIATKWSWPEQLKLWSGLKKELHLEMALESNSQPDGV